MIRENEKGAFTMAKEEQIYGTQPHAKANLFQVPLPPRGQSISLKEMSLDPDLCMAPLGFDLCDLRVIGSAPKKLYPVLGISPVKAYFNPKTREFVTEFTDHTVVSIKVDPKDIPDNYIGVALCTMKKLFGSNTKYKAFVDSIYKGPKEKMVVKDE